MGGAGSGNRWRIASRNTCESFMRIELNYMRKRGLLEPGYTGQLNWSRGGDPAGHIRFRAEHDALELDYSYRQPGETEWTPVNERIHYQYSLQPFGGTRRWFECRSCRKRCGVLYGGTHYRCRRCWGLAYKSQSEPDYVRAHSQALKIRKRLGGEQCLDEPFPEKPKGMHWRTYHRIREKSEVLEQRADESFVTMFAQLAGIW